jgi:hypothetical protein
MDSDLLRVESTRNWESLEDSQVVFIHPGKYYDSQLREYNRAQVINLVEERSGTVMRDLNGLTTIVLIPDSTSQEVTHFKRMYDTTKRGIDLVQFYSLFQNGKSSLPVRKAMQKRERDFHTKTGKYSETNTRKKPTNLGSQFYEDDELMDFTDYSKRVSKKRSSMKNSKKSSKKRASNKKKVNSAAKKKKSSKKPSSRKKKSSKKPSSKKSSKKPSSKKSSKKAVDGVYTKKRSTKGKRRSSKKRKLSPKFLYWHVLMAAYRKEHGGGFVKAPKKKTAAYRKMRKELDAKFPKN